LAEVDGGAYDDVCAAPGAVNETTVKFAQSLLPPWSAVLEGLGGLARKTAGAQSGDGDKSPFYAHRPGPRAALCLHGFTGTPFEVRPLAEALAAQGFSTMAPVLAGHGGTVDELARTTYQDWLASAEAALKALSADAGGAPIAIAGFSMGGLLALRRAHLYPDRVGALAIMAAPLRLRALEAGAARALGRLPRILRRGLLHALPKSRGFDVTDPEMAAKNPSLPAMPLAGVISLLELGDLVRQDLATIKAPVLVAHGARDRTVPFEDSLELCGTIGSTIVERLWLERSGHLLAIDVEKRTLIDGVTRFFTQQIAAPVPKAQAGKAAT
jgi:carboxylesterase